MNTSYELKRHIVSYSMRLVGVLCVWWGGGGLVWFLYTLISPSHLKMLIFPSIKHNIITKHMRSQY